MQILNDPKETMGRLSVNGRYGAFHNKAGSPASSANPPLELVAGAYCPSRALPKHAKAWRTSNDVLNNPVVIDDCT